MHKHFALSLGIAAFVLVAAQGRAGPGQPQAAVAPPCGERAAIVARLADTYGETRHAAGLSNGRAMVEVYASARTGTWTIIATHPDGRACLVASGQSFQDMARHLPPPGEPA